MKLNQILSLATISAAIYLTSCRTTEENYRAAYLQATMEAQTAENTSKEIETIIAPERIVNTSPTDKDNIITKTDFIFVVDGEKSDLKPYSVVVGDFTQQFIAKSYRDRLINEHQTHSYILRNSENRFFTIIEGFETEAEAKNYIYELENEGKIKLPIERAWILIDAKNS